MFLINFAVVLSIACLIDLVPVDNVLGYPAHTKLPPLPKLEVIGENSESPDYGVILRLFPANFIPPAKRGKTNKTQSTISAHLNETKLKPRRRKILTTRIPKIRKYDMKLWAAQGSKSSDNSGSIGISESNSGVDPAVASSSGSMEVLGSGPGASGQSNSKSSTTPKELTVSVPIFKTDKWGDWVYNPWAATFGKVWVDTRFKFPQVYTIPRMHLDSYPVRDYYGNSGKLSTVCIGKSTIYNVPKVYSYLRRNIYNYTHRSRPIWIGLRRELYNSGNSEECHSPKQTKWRPYQECALRRNMRMEYVVPKYPLHQIGYWGHYWRPPFDKK